MDAITSLSHGQLPSILFRQNRTKWRRAETKVSFWIKSSYLSATIGKQKYFVSKNRSSLTDFGQAGAGRIAMENCEDFFRL
jgi:hypothetical protein